MSPSLLSGRHAALLLTAVLAATSCTEDPDPNETGKETPGLEDTGTFPETSPEGAPGIVVKETSGLKTTEAGGTATFTIALALKPSADVTIVLTSSKPTEGNVDLTKVVFTSDNWDAPQTVTVTGVDDTATDGPQDYTIVTAPAVSADPRYNNLDGADVTVTNADDESAGVTVTPTTGLKTTEAGDEATFTVRLNTKPTADVTIALTTSNDKEGTVSPASVTFTAANWNAPQTVTVKGVDDTVADGTQTYKIVTAPAKSTDTGYNGLDPEDVTLTNIDDESPGVRVTPTAGLTTTESGGTATFTVRLNSKPSADVTIPLSSSKTTEGTVSPASVVFTAENWNAPQTVTITGVDDSAADGNQAFTIVTGAATSTDPGYAGVNADDVSVTNVDDESAGFTVTPLTGLVTTESGGSAAFTIRLNSKPNGSVVVGLTSSNVKEGTVGPAAVTFTADNWNAPQTVTVTGVDDSAADGAQVYKVITAAATGTDTSGYVGMNPADVSVTNTDNDTPGFTVGSAVPTTESGGTTMIAVRLNSQPLGTVGIPVTSSDLTEGTVSASLNFDATNWNVDQFITVKGVDDFVADGNQGYFVQLGTVTGTDTSGYVGLNPPDVALSNIDDDSAGVTVTVPPTGLTTTEAGGKASFTIKLNSQPTANVTIPLSSSRTTEGTISPASVTFTAANWNTPQTVTLTGVDDSVADGNQTYAAIIGATTSTDSAYNGLNPADPSATNTDNDSAGIIVTPTSGLVTTEAGGTASFTIVLTSAPTATVSISVLSSDSTEGTLGIKAVAFDASNWNKAQTVTITGVDDALMDGAVAYSITTGAAVSTDPNYSGRAVADVSVTNTDNEPDCTTSACGGSCAEIHKRYPALPDGNYLIISAGTKEYQVYCHNMAAGGFEYLNVDAATNYSEFPAVGKCAAACGGYIVYYDRIRFDPFKLTINTSDQTFATQKGKATAACLKGAGCYPYSLSYASTAACESTAGVGRANLGKNPFAFGDGVRFSAAPVGVGESFKNSFTVDRRAVDITGGAKGCSSYGFSDGSGSSPVRDLAAPLMWSP